jgi:hypothetical protein
VKPHYLRGHVEAALLEVFASSFHPDRLTFGEGVALSRILGAAQSVEGVQSVEVKTFERLYERRNDDPVQDFLALAPGEVARLDNDVNFPEHGRLRLIMDGGR